MGAQEFLNLSTGPKENRRHLIRADITGRHGQPFFIRCVLGKMVVVNFRVEAGLAKSSRYLDSSKRSVEEVSRRLRRLLLIIRT